MTRDELGALLAQWLTPERFTDSAENGLQVEGKAAVHKVACGVSANRAFLERAAAWGADAVVVHHGLVWGGIRKLDGWLAQRVRTLMQHDMSLFAFHLPLDAHPTLGNNAGLARALELHDVQPFGRYKGQLIGTCGALREPRTLAQMIDVVTERIGKPLVTFGDAQHTVSTIGVCSGGAPDLFHDAIAERLDLYVTGEVTEWVQSLADETGVAFIAAGHHATERFGPRALSAALAEAGLESCYIDVDNPA